MSLVILKLIVSNACVLQRSFTKCFDDDLGFLCNRVEARYLQNIFDEELDAVCHKE